MLPSHNPAATDAPDLTTVLLDVLGDLAFMVTDDEPADWPPGTVWLQAQITYHGPATGTLRCWGTREFGTRLAANLLGIEAADAQAQIAGQDALREFMNVLCGQLVTAWHGKHAVFTLSIPTVRECLEAPTGVAGPPRHVCRLSIEGQPLLCLYERAQPDP